MPKVVDIKKETIVKTAVQFINDNGYEALNARSLAASLGISTKPLYRIYNNMEEINDDIYKEVYHQYDVYINSRIDNQKVLLTLCIAYVEFAQKYKNLFKLLFLNHNLKWKKVEEVYDEKWNQSTIINLVNKHGYSFDEARNLFLNMWLYANGMATLVATNDIEMSSDDILVKLVKLYKVLAKKD